MGRIVKKLQDGFVTYHGRGIGYRNGSNILVTKTHPCYKPILDGFWMKPIHASFKVSTRANKYLENINGKYIVQSYLKALKSKKIDNYYSSEYDSDSDSDREMDSDDDTLIIDTKNTEIKTEDQNPDTRIPEQTPGSTADTPDQTPYNK